MKVAKKLTLIALLMFICGFIVLHASKITSYASTPSKSIQNEIPDYNKKVKNKYSGWIKSTTRVNTIHTFKAYKFYYMEKGKLVKGWKKISNKTYYFTSDYSMAYGVKYIDKNYYGFSTYQENYGEMLTSTVLFNDKNKQFYAFDSTGKAVKNGWVKTTTRMISATSTVHYETGYTYCSNYKVLSGFQKINGHWYFINENHHRLENEFDKIMDKWYYFDKNGVMQIGLTTIKKNLYYFNSLGEMVTGWKKINGNWYYFKSNGQAVSGTTMKINGKIYSFRTNGTCINP